MKLPLLILTRYRTVGVIFMLALAATMFIAGSADMILPHADSDCEDHCEEDCHGCNDCVRCVSSVHMIAADRPDLPAGLHTAAWDIPALVLESERTLARAIDHPPQNLL